MHRRWLLSLVAALFLVAQLGVATHSLHLDGGNKADVACGFCVTSHASIDGPVHAPALTFSSISSEVLSDGHSVVASFAFPSSARARAPPVG
jgi:hypothetical protein